MRVAQEPLAADGTGTHHEAGRLEGQALGTEAPMGRRLRKEELLDEIHHQRRALDDALAPLSPRQMTMPGVTRGGWSVKDVLAHLVEWQQMNLNWYAAGLRREKPPIPAPGFTLREPPRLNEMI
jgi:hypothetical protein